MGANRGAKEKCGGWDGFNGCSFSEMRRSRKIKCGRLKKEESRKQRRNQARRAHCHRFLSPCYSQRPRTLALRGCPFKWSYFYSVLCSCFFSETPRVEKEKRAGKRCSGQQITQERREEERREKKRKYTAFFRASGADRQDKGSLQNGASGRSTI